MNTLFRHAFVPALLVGTLASIAWHDRGVAWFAAHQVHLDFTTAVLFATIAVLSVAERLRPAHPEWNYQLLRADLTGAASWTQFGRDLLYLFFVTQVSALAIALVGARLEPAVAALHLAPAWPREAPFGVRVSFAFALVEFSSYWFHRAAHRVPWLWRFHRTHHVVRELTTLKAVRTHPVDNVFFFVCRQVPLLLLGAGPDDVIAAVSLGASLSLLAHANVDVAAGPLGLFVNYPAYHAVHHSANIDESNSNFGCHTVVFDRLFRTFTEHPREPLEVGVTPLVKRSLWNELIAPFYRRPE